MPIPAYQKLLLPVLEKMNDDNLYKRRELFDFLSPIIIKKYNITEQENIIGNNGLTRIQNNIGWVLTFLTKAEFVEKSLSEKMKYKITELGKTKLQDVINNSKTLNEQYLVENSENYLKNWNIKNANFKEKENETGEQSDFNLEIEIENIKQEREIDFINKLRSLDWQFFEDFCATLIEKMGYGKSSNRTIRVKDGGIDGILYNDELRFYNKIYIQAKRYAENNVVTSKDMQAFLYVIKEQKAKGVFITTSYFSKDAKAVAKQHEESGDIALIDCKKLIELAIKYRCGFNIINIEIPEINL
jgi:restriction system protein